MKYPHRWATAITATIIAAGLGAAGFAISAGGSARPMLSPSQIQAVSTDTGNILR